MASKNAANQNRWEAYYQKYQTDELAKKQKRRNQRSSQNQLTLEEKKRAIANFNNRNNRSQIDNQFKQSQSSQNQKINQQNL